MPRRAIPDRIDPPIARLELPVHDNAGSVVANARGVELEPVNRRPPPCSNQQMAAGDRLFGAGGFDRCRYGVASLFNAYDIYTAANNDTLAFEAIKKDGHAFRVVIAERSRSLKHGDRTSQTAEGLRQFEADRPGSNNDEMLRPLLEIENALVGKIGAAVEPGNWRHCRRRSGRDHEASRTDLDIACHDRVTILEFRMVVDDPDAKPRKSFGRIHRRHRCDDLLHVIAHLGEIDSDIWHVEPECARAAHCPRALGHRQQGFRRNAAGIETIAAHLVAFNQHRRHTKSCRSCGHRQSAGTTADYTNVGCECFRHAPASPAHNNNMNLTWRRASARANTSPLPASARADQARPTRRSTAASECPSGRKPCGNQALLQRYIDSTNFSAP